MDVGRRKWLVRELAAAVVLTLGMSVAMLALLASELMARRANRRLDVE